MCWHITVFFMQCLTLLVKEDMLLFFVINNFKTLKYMSLAFDEGFFMVSQHYTMDTAGKLHHLFSPKNVKRVIFYLRRLSSVQIAKC